jgi:hypothetical protein
VIKIGFSLCGGYAAIIVGCVSYAFLGGLDTKSRFMFLQIPIVLQSALADKLGLLGMLENISWISAYIILGGPIFAMLYVIGIMLDSASTAKMPHKYF